VLQRRSILVSGSQLITLRNHFCRDNGRGSFVEKKVDMIVDRGCAHRADATPFRVDVGDGSKPRVARSSQPWSECFNPVGIGQPDRKSRLLP